MVVLEESKTQTREATIIRWYQEVFPKVAAYIHRRGGDLETSKEIFQEAIVLYYEKLQREAFEPAVSDGAYLMGMAKKLWLKHQAQQANTETLDQLEVSDEKIPKPIVQKLMHYLKQSGERCMDLLQSFYYEKLSMQQVADRLGYGSERSATVQKYKCLEKVRQEVKQKSLSYEDFLD